MRCLPVTLAASALAAAALLPPLDASAQYATPTVGPGGLGIGLTYSVQTKTLNGEVAQVSPRGLVAEIDGQQTPVPMNRQTRVRIEGRGDAGFLQPGAFVSVWGKMTPEMTVREANLRVHVEPKQTAQWGRMVNVFEDDPQLSFVGRVVTVEPLVVQAMDTLVPAQRDAQGRAGKTGRPVQNAKIPLDLYAKSPEEVDVVFGTDLSMAAAGDELKVIIREDRPKVADAVIVKKSEVATSPAKRKAEGAAGAAGEGQE